MKVVENKTFDMERALYASEDLLLRNCNFDGLADGESALKESNNIEVQNCFFNLRYPFWHNSFLKIKNSELTMLCRAALWYSDNIEITDTKLHGIKALRECSNVKIKNCDIISPEFGWSADNVYMKHSKVKSEYFMMRSEKLNFLDIEFEGKYSFQYIKNAVFENCIFDTKDAFWHAKNVIVKDSVVRGEYLAWYSESLTMINCKIIGTQPFCYCKNLTLIDCEMTDTDLCFEKSEVYGIIKTPIVSIKNPLSGCIRVPDVEKLIADDANAKCEVIVGKPIEDEFRNLLENKLKKRIYEEKSPETCKFIIA